MNKFSKIISLALSAAICAGSALPVFASDTDEVTVNADNAVSVAAKEDFSIEKYPYSYLKTFNGWEQVKDQLGYCESSKFNNVLSTATANTGIDVVAGYQGDSVMVTMYSGHREDTYGGRESEASYGNFAQINFTTKNEIVYSDPTTGSQVGLTLEEAVKGTNKIAFWTKAEKSDKHDRQNPETISYSISFRDSGASGINVSIPSDGQWHYVVADLASPISNAFPFMQVNASCSSVFGSENGGMPYLKLDGRAGVYPVDRLDRPMIDIEKAQVLVNGEYVHARVFNIEYEPDPEGIYVNIPNGNGDNVYYRADDSRYIKTVNEEGGTIYVADAAGDYIYDTKSGAYIQMTDPEVNYYDRYSISNIESYQTDAAGNQILDDEGNPIPVTICGDVVYEVWQTQIYIDEMLFYRTTESGKRTTFLPSTEEDVAYYSNNDLDSVLFDGSVEYDIDVDGDNRVITLPRDFDLSNPDLSRFQILTKAPDVILSQKTVNGSVVPLDVSETGTMKCGSTGWIKLPSTIDGKAIVAVASAYGTVQEYEFDLKWGYDLSIVDKNIGNGSVSGGRKQFTIQNYSDEEKNVQILAAVKNKTTGELSSVSVSNASNGVIPAGSSKNVYLTVSLTGDAKDNPGDYAIYFYFYDSVTSMNQVVSTYVIS